MDNYAKIAVEKSKSRLQMLKTAAILEALHPNMHPAGSQTFCYLDPIPAAAVSPTWDVRAASYIYP